MPRYLLLILLIGLPLAFIAWEIFKFSFGISGTRSAFQKDVKLLADGLNAQSLSLWNLSELDLLSRRGESRTEDDMYALTETGQLYSIYDEPIVGFAKKKYKVNDHQIVLIRINQDIFKYLNKGDGNLEVYVNDKKLGSMSATHSPSKLVSDDSTVDIDNQGNRSIYPVSVDGKHVLSINSDDSQTQSRVLTKLEPTSDSESKSMLALMIHGLITDHL